eukprot:gene15329-4590_t
MCSPQLISSNIAMGSEGAAPEQPKNQQAEEPKAEEPKAQEPKADQQPQDNKVVEAQDGCCCCKYSCK